MSIKKTINWLVLLALFSFRPPSAPASNQVPAPPQKQPVALVGGTIHPVSAPAIERGTILFEKGRITALGPEVKVPPGAIEVDVRGKHIYPGLIAVGSFLGLTEISSIRATRDFAEIGRINPNVRAERAINPGSEHIPVTRANGIALAAVMPYGGLISGMGALVMLDGWTWEEMTLKAPLCMLLNWPDMQGITGFGPKKELEEQRKRLKGQIEELEEAFRQARAYKAAREAAGAKGVPFHETDVRWEAMLPVLSGELPVWVTADRLQEIEAAVEWADREGIRMVLMGGADAPEAAELLKSKDIPVIAGPILRLPLRRDSNYDEEFTLPARLYKAGITYCIGGAGFISGGERNLPYQASMAAAYGLPKEEALKAITLYAARILGVESLAGSLEKGKDATLIVTDGDPLEITTQVEKLYIQGKDVDLNNKQKTLYSKYKEKYRQLGER
ncbi:MAG TPA: amidohydrolase family protein [archaeon]|nr:amidohydrolase family protein [archaeon]